MKKIVVLTTSCLMLAACSTPMTTLKHEKTGQIATCGGSMTGSAVGGVIGYNIEKNNNMKCVETYKSNGFDIVDVK